MMYFWISGASTALSFAHCDGVEPVAVSLAQAVEEGQALVLLLVVVETPPIWPQPWITQVTGTRVHRPRAHVFTASLAFFKTEEAVPGSFAESVVGRLTAACFNVVVVATFDPLPAATSF